MLHYQDLVPSNLQVAQQSRETIIRALLGIRARCHNWPKQIEKVSLVFFHCLPSRWPLQQSLMSPELEGYPDSGSFLVLLDLASGWTFGCCFPTLICLVDWASMHHQTLMMTLVVKLVTQKMHVVVPVVMIASFSSFSVVVLVLLVVVVVFWFYVDVVKWTTLQLHYSLFDHPIGFRPKRTQAQTIVLPERYSLYSNCKCNASWVIHYWTKMGGRRRRSLVCRYFDDVNDRRHDSNESRHRDKKALLQLVYSKWLKEQKANSDTATLVSEKQVLLE